MKINEKGLEMIKHFESLKLKSYLCPANVWTIGYGTTGSDIVEGLVWTENQANERLLKDLEKFERGVENLLKVEVNENQFSALVSFAYNVGLGALKNSTMLKKINSSNFDGAAQEFLRWNKVKGKVLNGLTRRREAEKKLFEEKECQTMMKTTSGDIMDLNPILNESPQIIPQTHSQVQKTIFISIVSALKKFLKLE